MNSVFGIDVSHYQEGFDWTKAINSPYPEDPQLKFAIIKISQGTKIIDSKGKTYATQARTAGLKIGYYHYAQQYTGNQIALNATAQANHFLYAINSQNLPKPNFPLILDMENNELRNEYWTKVKANNDLWINTFIAVLKNNTPSYNVILYGGKYWFDDYTNNNFGSVPLWHAQYPQKPEQTNPTVANGWVKNGVQNWTIWQFSSKGRTFGYTKNLDINVMKKDFFDKA